MSRFDPILPASGDGPTKDTPLALRRKMRTHSLRMPASDAPALPRSGADRRGLKIGLMGGSFNPAHDGHLHVAKLALSHLDLDEVWWLVSPQNPLKSRDDMAPFGERFASATKAAKHPRVKVKDLELHLATHFTADTLVELKRRGKSNRYVWIMGADNLISFHKWERASLILHTCAVAVFDRPTYSLRALASRLARRFARHRVSQRAAHGLANRRPPAWVFLHTRRHNASATLIRQARQQGSGTEGQR